MDFDHRPKPELKFTLFLPSSISTVMSTVKSVNKWSFMLRKRNSESCDNKPWPDRKSKTTNTLFKPVEVKIRVPENLQKVRRQSQ